MTVTTDLFIPARFSGPPGSANGGWAAGALAALVDDSDRSTTIAVRLMLPPPIDAPITVTTDEGRLVALDGMDQRVAEVTDLGADAPAPEAVPAVGLDVARAASAGYPGHTFHPFPTCFVCGTDRAEGDGLRIFPGQVDDTPAGRTRIATTWTPAAEYEDLDDTAAAGSANLPSTWAALDCIGGWAGDLTERLMVLGSMTAHVVRRPRIGVEHILVGEARGEEGRKVSTGVSLYDPTDVDENGQPALVAAASHIWITVDPATFA